MLCHMLLWEEKWVLIGAYIYAQNAASIETAIFWKECPGLGFEKGTMTLGNTCVKSAKNSHKFNKLTCMHWFKL